MPAPLPVLSAKTQTGTQKDASGVTQKDADGREKNADGRAENSARPHPYAKIYCWAGSSSMPNSSRVSSMRLSLSRCPVTSCGLMFL